MLCEIELSSEDIDRIVLASLRDTYSYNESNPYEHDDKFQKHLRKVIRHYSTCDEYDAWLASHSD